MPRQKRIIGFFLGFVFFLGFSSSRAADPPVTVQVRWDRTIRISNTKPTLLLGASPDMWRKSPLHDKISKALADLGADDVRYAGGGYVYPHFGILELDPPTGTKTSWDFSYVDPVTEDLMTVRKEHPWVLNFSAIPDWMLKTDKPVPYPADPTVRAWQYEQGSELRDPTAREVGEYFARVVAWHVNGGFIDELGEWHESGHHWKVDYWEVLNEPDNEHGLSAESYTTIYDAVVEVVHKVSPQTKFVGLSDSYPAGHPKLYEYFLNPKNHKPGIPLDMISYHFYAVPNADEPPEAHQFTFFNQADRFLEITGYLETIRKMLSPTTGTMVNEIGTMLPEDWTQTKPGYKFTPIRPAYWNLSAAVYAYVYAGLARLGIEDAAESGIPTAPGMWPSIAMLDWETGEPNARYWVLKLIHDSFPPGDQIVETSTDSGYVMAQAFVSPHGVHKLLVVNKRDRELVIGLPEVKGAKVEVVDQTTASNPPATRTLSGPSLKLGGFGVAVVTFVK